MHVLNFITALGGGRWGLLPTCKRRIADMQPTYYRHAIDVLPTQRLSADCCSKAALSV